MFKRGSVLPPTLDVAEEEVDDEEEVDEAELVVVDDDDIDTAEEVLDETIVVLPIGVEATTM